MKKVILSVSIIGILLTSCSSDDDGGIISDTTGIDVTGIDVPSSYSFTRNNNTTVSFSGQTTRLKQVAELGDDLKSTTSTLTSMETKFKSGTGFTDSSLDGSKKVRNKTANSLGLFTKGTTNNADAIKVIYDGYISSFVNNVQQPVKDGVIAAKGIPGIADGKRNVNGDGLEYNQAFLKSLIGGLVADQVSNHYLNRLDDDNFENTNVWRTDNDADKLDDDSNFTVMEHHWDEAYGYVYGVAADDDVLMQKYINRVESDEDFKGTAQKIIDAFIIGRAAIVAKNYTVRDASIKVIREELAKVIGIRSVYYLQQGKSKLANRETAFHDLSEGYGFVYSLQFISLDGRTLVFTQGEVNDFISDLQAGDGFWDITEAKLNEISNAIAAKFNFTVQQAASLEKA